MIGVAYEKATGEYGEDSGFELIPIEEDDFDKVGWTNLLYSLPKDQLKLLICLFLGLKPHEIVETLHFPGISRYYTLSTRLRQSYLAQKAQFID